MCGAAARPGCGGGCVLCYGSLASLYRGGCRQESAVVQTPDYCFGNPFLGVVRGGTGVCSFRDLMECLRCRVVLLMGPQPYGGLRRPCLWSGMLGACVKTLWSHMVAPVFRELLCLDECVSRCCFHIVFDSAGSAGVVSGPTLVVGRGVALFRCFVVLCRIGYPYWVLFARLTPLLSSGLPADEAAGATRTDAPVESAAPIPPIKTSAAGQTHAAAAIPPEVERTSVPKEEGLRRSLAEENGQETTAATGVVGYVPHETFGGEARGHLGTLSGERVQGPPPCPTTSQLEVLARCQGLSLEDTPEILEEVHQMEHHTDEDDDVEVEALEDGIMRSLAVLRRLAMRARDHRQMWDAEFAFCEELEERH
ncbi:hypothetical protein Taro_050363 [Colocasia esculenta]|uniref:Uncharacterized protein n=1 Tax=Colocasia esculenta TaxID=4460 RepID=A0A843XDM7_COLES|nr:hypothetical protein [Colocasia esculenta]